MFQAYDVIAVGSGPAVLFALAELTHHTPLRVLLLEKARRLNDSRNVSNGWFGGSARALVHMFLTPGFGGSITDPAVIGQFVERLKTYSATPLRFAQNHLPKKTLKLFEAAGVAVDEPETIIYSEDRMIKLGDFLYKHLKAQATVLHKTDLHSLCRTPTGDFEIRTNNGSFIAPRVILGLGRGGSEFYLSGFERNFELAYQQDRYQLGVRIEFSSQALQRTVEKNSLFRLRFGDYKTTVPTIQGAVETEETSYLKNSNGRTINSSKGPLANLGLLRTFRNPNAHDAVYRLVEMVNVLSDGQLFRDSVSRFIAGDTVINPIPEYDQLRDGVSKIAELFPAIKERGAVYAPEARVNSIEFELTPQFETTMPNLFIVGDMSGKTKSFVQAACSGLLAAGELARR